MATTKAMWEVDPSTRSKLSALSTTNGNALCIDCGAPSPQWASPKLGIFLCLACAGVHRGLGVHISFVRSVGMDAFKPAEIARMQRGGNARWRAFFDAHPQNKDEGVSWDDVTIAERYGGDVAREWKDRLTAEVDGVEYVPAPPEEPQQQQQQDFRPPARSHTTGSFNAGGRASPSPSTSSNSKAKVDAAYFSRLGSANASRPADLPPSQGGKFAGFGSEMPTPSSSRAGGAGADAGPPNLDDLQRDPVAALTRGFGWFGGVVGRGARVVGEGYIAPAAARLAEADLAAQAARFAETARTGAQGAGRTLNQGFSRFVEGDPLGGGGGARAPLDETKRDFWDGFGRPAEERGAIGTSALKSGGAGGQGGMGGFGGGDVGGDARVGAGAAAGGEGGKKERKEEKDEWDNW